MNESHAPTHLLERVEIETPEHVSFSYEVAGLGSRFCALWIDSVLMLLGGSLLFLALVVLLPITAPLGEWVQWITTAWVLFFVLLALFLLYWAYFLFFESRWDGQTPGKKVMKLRAVAEAGHPLSPGAAAVRNLLRAVDMQPGGTYFVGAATILLNRQSRRLGDLAAGTVVIRERIVSGHADAFGGEGASGATPVVEGPPRLGEQELALLEGFLSRSGQLAEPVRQRVRSQLLSLARARYAQVAGEEEWAFLERVRSEEHGRRRAAGTGRPPHTQSEVHARFVRAKEPRWRLFASYLARTRRRGLRGLTPSELSEMAELYRETAADLARARTYRAEPRLLFQLERLVGAGHSAFYRRRSFGLRGVWRFIRHEFPALVRRLALPIGISGAALLLPALIAYARVALEPEVAYSLLDPEILMRAESAPDRIAEGRGYVEIPSPFMPLVAGGIIANNVQVTIMAFGLGITAGLGTLLLLLFNGVHIGATLALFDSAAAGTYLWSFVLPHGIVELTAAAIAGGAGLWMGSALVLPGEQTRREALVERGREAVQLLLGTTLLLVLAGLVEGFVSPSALPAEAKMGFGFLLGALLVAYLSFTGTEEPSAVEEGSRRS